MEVCNTPFWDYNLTWAEESPDLSSCFQDFVLSPLPLIFLFIVTPFEIISLLKHEYLQGISLRRIQIITTIKFFTNFALIGTEASELLRVGLLTNKSTTVSQLISPAASLIGYVLILCLFIFSEGRGVRNSGFQFIFWFLSLIVQGIRFRSIYLSKLPRGYIIDLTLLVVIGLRFLLEAISGNKRNDYGKPSKFNESPDKVSPFISRIFLAWYDKLAWKGYRTQITKEDLWELQVKDTAQVQYSFLSQNYKKTDDGIFWPVLRTYGPKYCLAVILKLSGASLMLLQPIIVKLLVTHVSSNDPVWRGYFYLGVITTTCITQTLLMINSDKMTHILGMRARAALSSAIYRKSLKIPNTLKKDGEILNLISVDVVKCMEFLVVHNALGAPLLLFLSLYFLWTSFGVAGLLGLGSLFLLLIFSNILTLSLGTKYQKLQMKLKDQRIKLTNEALGGIKTLKLYAWEGMHGERIQKVRKLELKALFKLSFVSIISMTIYNFSTFLVGIVTFGYFVLMDPSNLLTPQKVFVLINIMNILRGPMIQVPMAVITYSQVSVSFKRISNFFRLEELKSPTKSRSTPGLSNEYETSSFSSSVHIKNGSFSWGTDQVLRDINIRARAGEVIGVVGRIGSGKSSLLNAILGEMKNVSGKVETNGTIAYVSQTPWIRNGTLRQNILFGNEFFEEKYKRVVEACSLAQDFNILSDGDQTEIGEKGVNLSGGQRQRLSLARAVYRDASIFLFDDPLSALDTRVGRDVFDNVIGPNGILKDKIRIFVTHSTHFLPQLSRIILIEDGRIKEQGSFQELCEKSGHFSEFLRSLTNAEDKESKKAEETEVAHDQNPSILNNGVSSKEGRKLVLEEKSAVGNIKFKVYYNYFIAGGYILPLSALVFFIVSAALTGYINVYLSSWSTFEDEESKANSATRTNWSELTTHLIEYSVLGVSQGIITFLAYLTLAAVSLIGTKKLQNEALIRLLHAPMSYFESTLVGNVLSRLSRDVEVMDYPILYQLRMVSMLLLAVIVTLTLISINTPIFIAVLCPLAIIYVLLQRFYVGTSRQLRRLESVSRSPVYAHFNETLSGLSTIRGFGMENYLITEAERRIDENTKCLFPFLISNFWMGLRLELIGSCVIFFTTLFTLSGSLGSGEAGLSITYALSITIYLNLLARLFSDLENNIISIERVQELTTTIQEAPWEIPSTLPQYWPVIGRIDFNEYWTQYREGTPPVLRGLTLNIDGGEKIGVVGRTGAGKSSLTLALLRILEPMKGKITIDGIDISKLGLHDLRKKITIIPQDPVLFSGSLRQNLDPAEEYSDEEIWRALESAHLKQKITAMPAQLNEEIQEDGKNFSVGERQLVCLCRALLRNTRILVLDEATGGVDPQTDQLIQITIKEEFKSATTITIAHRLNTILHSDRVLVLGEGKILEYDTPIKLLQDPKSTFRDMAKHANLI